MEKNPKQRGLGMGLGALIQQNSPVEVDPDKQKRNQQGESKAKSPGKTRGNQSTGSRAKESTVGYLGDVDENTVVYVDIDNIKPNANQPRKNFDEEKIRELADSILEHGIIQPLIVRKSGSAYEIVAGERRYRAARKAKLAQVPCIIRDFTDEENMLIAIIENMQREDLNPVEEAEGLNQMVKSFGLTQEEVSKSVGKSRPYITNALRLLNLPTAIRQLLAEGAITAGHARALLSMTDAKAQNDLAKKIAREGLSVRETERLAGGKKSAKRASARTSKNDEIVSVEDELKQLLGTKVTITGKGRSGNIAIEYYSLEELNRLIDLLRTVNG